MKTAIVVLSDPKNGSEESLGRVFNALAAAYDFKQAGDDVQVYFQGAGARWAGELVKPGHPAHTLYNAVKDKVAGVSCGCTDVFGAAEGVARSGLDLIKENMVPGTSGFPSLQKLVRDGYSVVTF